MQKIILPISNMIITAGFRNRAYRNRFGFTHYGLDAVSTTKDRNVYACGDGVILAAGTDSILGNTLIIHYPLVYNHHTGTVTDMVLRHYHMHSLAVKRGDNVKLGDVLGVYGNTGRYSTGPHLHTEADSDIKYYAYSATGSRQGTLIKPGTSTTMPSPAELWHLGVGQSLQASKASFGGLSYVEPSDWNIIRSL